MSDSVTLFIGLRSIEPIQYASPLIISSETSDFIFSIKPSSKTFATVKLNPSFSERALSSSSFLEIRCAS